MIHEVTICRNSDRWWNFPYTIRGYDAEGNREGKPRVAMTKWGAKRKAREVLREMEFSFGEVVDRWIA